MEGKKVLTAGNVYSRIQEMLDSDILNERYTDALEDAKMYVGAFNQIKLERDIAISQLEDLGIGLGRDMTGIRVVFEDK